MSCIATVLAVFDSAALDAYFAERPNYPVLLHGTNICRDCGESYGQDALCTRCLRRHWQWQDRPCGKCAGVIDYRSPRKLDDGTINPKVLTVARIVAPVQAKALGWGLEQTNALSNRQPVHAACARSKA
jgi:hypothetical protein